LFFIEALSPRKISSLIRGIRAARNTPALEMLAPCREAKQFRGFRRKVNKPCLHAFGVDEFSGPPVLPFRIGRMSGVDELARN
jgi:hypothetical protein